MLGRAQVRKTAQHLFVSVEWLCDRVEAQALNTPSGARAINKGITMSKTDPKCYPPGELGWHDDRDWLDRIFDAWHAGAESMAGIHRVIYLLGSPFPDTFEFMGVNRSRDTYRFPMRSSYLARHEKRANAQKKRMQKEMLNEALARVIDTCKAFPPPKTSN